MIKRMFRVYYRKHFNIYQIVKHKGWVFDGVGVKITLRSISAACFISG